MYSTTCSESPFYCSISDDMLQTPGDLLSLTRLKAVTTSSNVILGSGGLDGRKGGPASQQQWVK